MRVCMSVAGSDSCAGAGIQADLKTFAAHGVYGLTAVTAVTAQNTCGVQEVQEMRPGIVQAQIDCLFQDFFVHAVKIGMLSSAPIIEAVAESLDISGRPPVVLDPVMLSKSGHELLAGRDRQLLIQRLFPLADVITPNLLEAGLLTGEELSTLGDMERAAKTLRDRGARVVIVKGGHLRQAPGTDVYCDEQGTQQLPGEFVNTSSTHGTGCTFSSAIAANLALGCEILEAAQRAKVYTGRALAASRPLGRGHGPLAHFQN